MLCSSCGAQNAETARFCSGCGTQFNAPESGGAFMGGGRIARLGDRALAVVLDGLLLIAAFAAIGMLVAKRLGGVTESGFSLNGGPALLAIGGTLLAAFLYYWLFEGLFSATLGKGLMGIRVRMSDGSGCGLRASLTRNLLRVIDALAVYLVGFIIAMLSKMRQRLGDRVAGTVVVEKETGALARTALLILWVLLTSSGFTAAYYLHRGVSDGAGVTGRTAPETLAGESRSASAPHVDVTSSGSLKMTDFQFLQSKDGPARRPAPYEVSEKVFVKYDIGGYSTADGRPKLAYTIAAADPNGLPMHAPWKDVFAGELEKGSPVHGTFNLGLPPAVPTGVCNLIIRVRDELNNAELEIKAPFSVEAAAIAPAKSLEVRDFQVSLAQDGPAMETPELDGGGTIYMRCGVFGLQFRGDEAGFRMALRVVGPGGKVVLENPDYANVRDTWVYHPPTFYVPVTGHLSIPSSFDKGAYRAVYTFTDPFANSTVVNEAAFRVK